MQNNSENTISLRRIFYKIFFYTGSFLTVIIFFSTILLAVLNYKGTEFTSSYYPFNASLQKLLNEFDNNVYLFDLYYKNNDMVIRNQLIKQLQISIPKHITTLTKLTVSKTDIVQLHKLDQSVAKYRRIVWRITDSYGKYQKNNIEEEFYKEITPIFNKLKYNINMIGPASYFDKKTALTLNNTLYGAQGALKMFINSGNKSYLTIFENNQVIFKNNFYIANNSEYGKAIRDLMTRYFNGATMLIEMQKKQEQEKKLILSHNNFFSIRDQVRNEIELLISYNELKMKQRIIFLNTLGYTTLSILFIAMVFTLFFGHSSSIKLLKRIIYPIETLTDTMFSISQGKKVNLINQSNISELNLLTASFHEMQTQRELQEQKILSNAKHFHYLAFHDSLTKLLNHPGLVQHLTKNIDKIKEKNLAEKILVLQIMIHNVENICNIWGIQFFEKLLIAFSNILTNLQPQPLLIGRLDHQRIILCFKVNLNTPIKKMTELIFKSIKQQMRSFHENAIFQLSMGAAIYPDDARTSIKLLKFSGYAANYCYKDLHQELSFFNHEIKKVLVRKKLLEKNFEKALANNEFYILFQPQFHSASKKIRGFEVLVRWKNNLFGEILPTEFIQIAEQNDLMILLGQYIQRLSIKQYYKWQDLYQFRGIISINASLVEILSPGFSEFLSALCKEHGVSSSHIEIEITESIATSHESEFIEIVQSLRQLGFKVAIDDFGTGYSSLKRLRQQRVDLIKIDKYFIDDISDNITSRNFLIFMIRFSKVLNLPVLAEGVESENQFNILKEAGCEYVQGFFLGKPLSSTEAEKLLIS